MSRFVVVLLLILISALCVNAQTPSCTLQLGYPQAAVAPPGTNSGAQVLVLLCPAQPGFTLISGNYVKLNVQGTAIANGVVGDAASVVVGVGMAVLGGQVFVKNSGVINVNFDGAATGGNVFTVSTTTAGYLHDQGTSTCTATSLGKIISYLGAAGVAQVWWGSCP